MTTDQLIEALTTGNARLFLGACIEYDPIFLEALVAEICYGISTEVNPLDYVFRYALLAKPLTDGGDVSDDILSAEEIG